MCKSPSSPKFAVRGVQYPHYMFVAPKKDREDLGEDLSPRSSLSSLVGFVQPFEDVNAYEIHEGTNSALAVVKNCDDVQVCSKGGMVSVLLGGFMNAQYLNMKHCEDNCCTDAEIALELYSKMGFTCLSKFKGRFNLLIFNKNEGTAFAATDAFHSYNLFQGSDSTGGLLLTNAASIKTREEFKLSKIPPSSFVFGKHRGRNVHKYASSIEEFNNRKNEAKSAALKALSGLKVSVC